MSYDICLWTLNGATNFWEREGRSWLSALRGPGRDAFAGDRNRYNRTDLGPIKTKTSRLMHELDDLGGVDEYWLPIAVKCMGDIRHLHARTPTAQRPLLGKIRDHYRDHFQRHKDFWNLRKIDRDVRMATKKHIGLYEILCRESERYAARNNGRELRHVLVGVSEGGLVARYLAFIDEFVCRARRVAGVVTINTPHLGSTFASERNAPNVSSVMLGSGLGFAGFGSSIFDKMFDAAYAHQAFDLRALRAVLRAGMEDVAGHEIAAAAEGDFAGPVTQRLERNKAYIGLVKSAYRWLSGLDDDGDYAFRDIDPGLLDEAFSVLGSVHQNPTAQVQHGAIIGINDSVEDLALSLTSAPPQTPLDWLRGLGVISLVAVNYPMVELFNGTDSLVQQMRAAARRVRPQIQRAIDEDLTGAGPELKKANKLLERGLDDDKWGIVGPWKVSARRHDFIIPSAYQAWPPPTRASAREKLFLGNWVNKDANHLVCGVDWHASGRENARQVTAMLKKMSENWA